VSRVLVEFDYKGVEAVLCGHFAGDSDYVAITRKGHGIFASHILGRPISHLDPSADAVCAQIKREEPRVYAATKTVSHLSNYGGTPFKIWQDHKKLFKSEDETQALQDLYFREIFKRGIAWQVDTLRVAHTRHWLQNAFKYRHYFWDVLARRKPKQRKESALLRALGDTWELASDAKRALAFLAQSTVPGVICEVLLRLGPAIDALRLQIHDALLFELLDDGSLDRRISFIKGEMERPVAELGGLVLPVEVKIGKNWGEMKEYEIQTDVARVAV
jgi:hypothetical protein